MKIRFLTTVLALACFGLAASGAERAVERRIYVTDSSGISIYDADEGHKLVRKIAVPNSGDYKGIAASPQLGRLYITSHVGDDLICLDLATETVLWRKPLGKYADSMWTTPDGQRLYLPFRDESNWRVIDAKDGSVLATIETERGKQYEVEPIGSFGPHNTWINPAGTRVYMEILTVPYLYVAETKNNRVLGKIGPFSRGVRPFAVSDDERFVYANVDGLLGFEIAEIQQEPWGGKMIRRVEVKTPSQRLAEIPNPPKQKPHSTPSHGINLRPDQAEVWVVDGVYGYVYVFDVTSTPPKQVASIPLYQNPRERPHPSWITFGINGQYAYPDGGAVIDSHTKKIVARIPTSEKMIEIDFADGKPIRAGHR